MLAGLACIALLYLFFIPNSSLFGITYIGHGTKINSAQYEIADVQKIKVSSNRYDVEILESANDKIGANLTSKTFGYCLVKNKNVNMVATLKNGVLTIDVTEPTGWLLDSDSKLKIMIPASHSVDLELINNKAMTKINSNISINNLTYTTNRGDFSFTSGKLNGDLDLNLGNANFTIGKDAILSQPSVNIELDKGKFSALHHDLNNVVITKSTAGVIEAKKCNSLMGSLGSAGGKIEIDTVNEIDFVSSDTNVYIHNLDVENGSEDRLAYIELTQTGRVQILNLNGEADIITSSGSLIVNKSSDVLTLTTISADITVAEAYKLVTATSTYGNITVNFAADAESYTTDNLSRSVELTTSNGKISSSGIEHAYVNALGTGRVYLNFNNVYGSNNVFSNRGETYVFISQTATYYLTTSSDSGKVYVNFADLEVNGYETKFETTTPVNGCTEPNTNLIVRTASGDLTVIDNIY